MNRYRVTVSLAPGQSCSYYVDARNIHTVAILSRIWPKIRISRVRCTCGVKVGGVLTRTIGAGRHTGADLPVILVL
jgi:hypothetical protein